MSPLCALTEPRLVHPAVGGSESISVRQSLDAAALDGLDVPEVSGRSVQRLRSEFLRAINSP
jgi:hypothetical protein